MENAKLPPEIEQIKRMFESLTVCPVCFSETRNRGEVVTKAVRMTFPVCSESHLQILMKGVFGRLDPQKRRRVRLVLGENN